MLFLFLAQAAAPAPDVEIGAHVDIERLTIQKKGEARLNVAADPDAGSIVHVEAPRADGRVTLRNVRIDVRGEARIADPASAAAASRPGDAETSSPPSR